MFKIRRLVYLSTLIRCARVTILTTYFYTKDEDCSQKLLLMTGCNKLITKRRNVIVKTKYKQKTLRIPNVDIRENVVHNLDPET